MCAHGKLEGLGIGECVDVRPLCPKVAGVTGLVFP